ncbi:MAG TPA: ankyrin repeat domain-containing protein [Candidatus Wallbacteria bacterium]|nr:ankyrin repeat domain-containing protein [Candidatus Wallbacteria bacterium]
MNLIKITLLSILTLAMIYGNAHGKDMGKKHEKSFINETSSGALKATKITPVMDTEITTGENLIFCSTFQMAWNELCSKYVEGTLEIENAPVYVEKLNQLSGQPPLLDKESYIAMSGFGGEGIINKVNETVNKKFGHLNQDELPPKFNYHLGSNEIFVFSYLYKNLEFKEEFDKLPPMLMCNNNKVFYAEAFGLRRGYIKNHKPDTDKRREQFNLIYHNDYGTVEVDRPKGIILSLVTESNSDEIILSTVPVSGTLTNSYNIIKKIIDKSTDKKNFVEILRIPKINFNILHEYNELNNKIIMNNPFIKYMDRLIFKKAVQKFALNLNEKGSKIVSYEYINITINYIQSEAVIKCPFMIYFRDKTKDTPYFMAYVANDELLVKPAPIDHDTYGKFDAELSQNPILRQLINNLYLCYGHIIDLTQYINCKNENGSTTLILALKKRNFIYSRFYKSVQEYNKTELNKEKYANELFIDLIKYLIKNKADVNACGNDGKTPLMYAVEANDTESVKLLIDSGADISLRQKNGKCALDIARKLKYNKIIKILKEVNKKDKKRIMEK